MRDFQNMELSEAQAITNDYVAARPAALARFHSRWRATRPEPFVGTLGQADELQQWFYAQLEDGVHPTPPGLPLVFRGSVEEYNARRPPDRWMTRERLWLADDVAAAVELVVAQAVPDVRWVCFTALAGEGDMRAHEPSLIIGDPAWPLDPTPWRWTQITGAHQLRGRGNPLWQPRSWTEQLTEEVDHAWRWWAKQGVDRAAWEAARA